MLAWWGSCAVRCGTLCPASQWIKVKVVRLHAVSTSVLTRTPVEITLLFVHVSPLAAYHHSTVSDTDFRLVGAGRQLREREQFTLRLQVHAPLFGRRTVPVYLTRPPSPLLSHFLPIQYIHVHAQCSGVPTLANCAVHSLQLLRGGYTSPLTLDE
jgi:hypothetical protein